jgi:peptide/nickel transport system substrate-binding protein
MILRLHLRHGTAARRNALLSEQVSRREALRRASLIGLGASAMAGLLSAGPAGQAMTLAAVQDETPRRGGSLRVAVPGSAETFDPNVAFVFEAIWACELLYSGLIRFTSDLQLEPELALSWEPNDTLDQWTFALREGVKWHDGGDFTSADVVATFDRIQDPALASPFRTSIGMVERAEATGPHEVVFHLSSPFSEFPELLSAYLARIVPAGKTDDLTRNPIGTGPYVLADWVPGERTVLRRFEDYYDLEGQAFLDEITYVSIPEEATKAAALVGGQVELANEYQPTSLPILQAPNVTIAEIASPGFQPIVVDVDEPPFDDVRVRRALKKVVDRDGFVAVVLQGHGEPAADQPVPPFDANYGNLPIPLPDIEGAIALLAEAGFPDGLDVTLHTSPGRPGMLESALTFKDMAAPAGIRVEVQSHPIDAYWADIWKKVPIYTSNWSGRPTAEQILSLVYLCDSSATEGNWCNPEFDERVLQSRATNDPEERLALLTEAQQLLADDGPAIVPYFRSYITAFSARLHGFAPHPYRLLDLRRAWLSE